MANSKTKEEQHEAFFAQVTKMAEAGHTAMRLFREVHYPTRPAIKPWAELSPSDWRFYSTKAMVTISEGPMNEPEQGCGDAASWERYVMTTVIRAMAKAMNFSVHHGAGIPEVDNGER